MSNVTLLKGRSEGDFEANLYKNPWGVLQTAQRYKHILQAEIRGIEPGDYRGKKEMYFVVWIGLVKGLIPLSESGTGFQKEEEMRRVLGSKVPVVIEDVRRSKSFLLLSVTKAKTRLATDTMKNLKKGDVKTGYVTRLTPAKAIIDIGGVDAELPKSEIAWSFVGSPASTLRLGQEVDVKVTNIDTKNNIVTVSKKMLEEDPWAVVTSQLQKNQSYLAEVTGSNDKKALYLKIFEGVYGMGAYGRELPVGTRVIVQITQFRAEERRINCRVMRVIDRV